MALTLEFTTAVENNNILRVRIMLKDSLLVDKSFADFEEMCRYAKTKRMNVWIEETDKFEKKPRASWDIALMNMELTKLVTYFTKEQVDYCKEIITKVYGSSQSINRTYSDPRTNSTKTDLSSARNNGDAGSNSINDAYYNKIIVGVRKMRRIINNNETEKGRTWKLDDIKKIQDLAEGIVKACKNIK